MQRQACPECFKVLTKYNAIKAQQYDYFFNNLPLKVNNNETIESFTEVYNLITENPQAKLRNQKKYQPYQLTFSKVFKADFTDFCEKVRQRLQQIKQISSPKSQLQLYYKWITNCTRFLFFTNKTFYIIQRNPNVYKKSSIYHQGLTILKNEIIMPLYGVILELIISNLQAFKQEKLQEYIELQFLIRIIGMCGFSKYKSICVSKSDMGHFEFSSINKTTNKKTEIEYQTDFFHKNFTTKIIKFLDKKYRTMAQQMIKLSTSEYVKIAHDLLKRQQKAAEYFYPNESVRNLITQSIGQVLIMEHIETLITKQKTGLESMIEYQDVESIISLYKLVKKTYQHKLLAQHFQTYVNKKIMEIISKISAQDEKMAKKQTVKSFIDSLYNFYLKIHGIAKAIHSSLDDPYDLILFTAVSCGFQTACSKGSLVCYFLVFYLDNILKKQSDLETNLSDLLTQVSKMLKFLHSLDTFLKVYQKMLGIRILYDLFKNRNLQLQLINLLKNQVGVSSLNKINSMIQDYNFSEQFNTQVNNFKNLVGFNMQVMLLTANSWPIPDSKKNNQLVPSELQAAVIQYQERYLKLFPGREVTWVFNFGRAITLVKFDQARYILYLNNYQLIVLLFMQRHGFKACKVSQLVDQLKPEEQPAFMASITMLIKRGVLTKVGSQRIQSGNDLISFNKNMKSKSTKIFCFEIPRYSQKTSNSVRNQLANDRAVLIQANIVKLMKAKKTLHYNDIINQAMKMCRTFKAEVPMIKNQIEVCLNKEFLARNEKDFNVLMYKP